MADGPAAVGVDLKGRIPVSEQAAAGRALGRLSDIGWGNRLRPLLARQASDGPVPDDVAKAVVGVLTDWAKGPGGWASGRPDAQPRPVGVVTMASRTRPQLIQSLGARIAEIGRLPLLGSVEYVGEASQLSRSNSAQRLKALDGALSVPPSLAEALRAAGRPGAARGRRDGDRMDARGGRATAPPVRGTGSVAAGPGRTGVNHVSSSRTVGKDINGV